jgi:flagellar assembly protein FliH
MWCRLLPDGQTRRDSPLVFRLVGETEPEKQEEPAPVEPDREIERRVKEAYAEGLRDGEAAGRKRGAADAQPVVERLGRTIDELAGLRHRLRREAEADLIQLSLLIARRILRRELSIDPEALRALVIGAIEKLQGEEITRVRVHPSHAPVVASCLHGANSRTVEVIPDAQREPGAVIFETRRGNLDASVESQLREVERGLTDRLRRHV